jgi:tRNA A37 threonylcarbamoyladenosine biosynthesis protein TsaE
MVEWPEKAPGLFTEETVHVFIQPVSETERKVEIALPLSAFNPSNSKNNRNL